MSFLSNIPQYIKDLEKKARAIKYEMAEMYHSCNCEYCDIDGEVLSEEDQSNYDHLNLHVKSIERQIQDLIDYSKRNGVDLGGKKL